MCGSACMPCWIRFGSDPWNGSIDASGIPDRMCPARRAVVDGDGDGDGDALYSLGDKISRPLTRARTYVYVIPDARLASANHSFHWFVLLLIDQSV